MDLIGQVMVQRGGLFSGPWGFTEILIAIIVVCACVGIAYVACNYFGITPPDWLVKIVMIVVVACVAIAAIRLVAGM